MERYLVIALSSHSKMEVFVYFLSVLLMSSNLKGTYSAEVSKPRRGSLGDLLGVY